MQNSISAKLYFGFGLMAALIAGGALFILYTTNQSEHHYEELYQSTKGAVLLANAQTGLDFADSLGNLVKSNGHEVHVAYDATSGLRLAGLILPHVVFHDIGLPGMDGYEAARIFRRDSRFQQTMLVAITGSADSNVIRSTKAAGFDRFIPKPMPYDAMLDALAATQAVG